MGTAREDSAQPSSVGHIPRRDRKSTRLNSSHTVISYAVFCLKKKKKKVTFTYNGQGQPLTVMTPAGTTTLSYVFGDLANMTDLIGNVTTKITDDVRQILTWPN